MLHGNPAVAVYGGIKLASSGELGIGVGEEERGSGEREVLEGFVGRVDGLVDLVVSRFGEAPKLENGAKGKQPQSQAGHKQPWLGTGAEPDAGDGAIFLGVGALSRKSLRDITHWMEDVYSWGPRAYGVMDNPTSTRQQHRKTKKRPTKSSESSANPTITSNTSVETERPPLPDPSSNSTIKVSKVTKAQSRRQSKADLKKSAQSTSREVASMSTPTPGSDATPTQETSVGGKQKRPAYRRAHSSNDSKGSTNSKKGGKFVDYFKLGYGTHWSLTGNPTKKEPLSPVASTPPPLPQEEVQIPKPLVQHPDSNDSPNGFDKPYYPADDSVGHYLVGLLGDVESEDPNSSSSADESGESSNTRVVVRTVTVELEREGDARDEKDISIDLSTAEADVSSKAGSSQHTGTSHASSFEGQDRNKTKKLRIVIYCKQPFIYTLLFELRTESLAFPTLYKSLHHQLAPLSRPLLASTSKALARPEVNMGTGAGARNPIYDLVWDPKTLIVSSSLPNIPGPSHAFDNQPPWSRLEALNTHTQLLNTFIATRSEITELERSCKTSRAYWIVWTRIPDPESPKIEGKTERLRSIEPISETGGEEISRLSTPDMIANLGEGTASMNLSGKAMSEFNNRTTPGPGSGSGMSPSFHSGAYDARKGSGRSGGRQKSARWSDTSRSWNKGTSSMNSGPAHPFFDVPNPVKEHLKVDKEVWLVRNAGEEKNGQLANGLGRGIGVDVPAYVQDLLAMLK